MVHYRDNWYVDAWCHLRKEIRSFAVDAITECEQLIEDAKELDAEQTITQLITKNAKFVFCEFCPSTGPFTEPGSVCPSSPHTLPFGVVSEFGE